VGEPDSAEHRSNGPPDGARLAVEHERSIPDEPPSPPLGQAAADVGLEPWEGASAVQPQMHLSTPGAGLAVERPRADQEAFLRGQAVER
jgi:hypothetical protein